MLPRKILENRVSLMPFSAFWCGFLCMKQVTNEKKILRILVKQNMNRKIARLLSKNCRLINISAPPPAPYAYGYDRYIHTYVLFQYASLTQQMLIHRRGVIPIVTTDN